MEPNFKAMVDNNVKPVPCRGGRGANRRGFNGVSQLTSRNC